MDAVEWMDPVHRGATNAFTKSYRMLVLAHLAHTARCQLRAEKATAEPKPWKELGLGGAGAGDLI